MDMSPIASGSGSGSTRPLDDGSPGDEASGSTSKPTRSRRGCFACRRRKVKCDEKPPVCRNCRIGDRQCHWPAPDEIHRNKKRKHPVLPANIAISNLVDIPPPQHPHDEAISLLALGESDLPAAAGHATPASFSSPSTTAAYASPISNLFPSSIIGKVPNLATSTSNSALSAAWPIPQLPPIRLEPPRPHPTPPRRRSNGATAVPGLGDAGLFSDILIAADKQAELMADSAFLQPYFPHVSDRLVMRHYLTQTVKVIMAFDSPTTPWNPWVSVHAAAAFRHEPGVSSANDALRTAILAVGAVHMRYGHNRSDAVSAWRITSQARERVLRLVKQSNVWENHGTRKEDEDELELVLAALLSCTIASSLAADDSWHELLTTVLGLIERLGGARQILQHASHDRMSLRRFVIEQLATRDVFGCMTTDLAPSILTDTFTPWFFEAEKWSNKEREWESIERMFGMSRRLVEIIARVCSLVAKVRRHDYRISEEGDTKPVQEASSINLRLPARVAARLSGPPSLTSNSSPEEVHAIAPAARPPATSSEQHRLGVQREANGLLHELKNWDTAYTFVPLHPRTQYGNHAYWHALRLRLLREVFRVPKDDERITSAVGAIMEISKEMLALYGRMVWMTWPILIAGFNMPAGDSSRSAALEFLCEFEPHACFDNAAACRTLLEFWKHNDVTSEDTLPTEVFRKLQSRPFLD